MFLYPTFRGELWLGTCDFWKHPLMLARLSGYRPLSTPLLAPLRRAAAAEDKGKRFSALENRAHGRSVVVGDVRDRLLSVGVVLRSSSFLDFFLSPQG